MAKYWWTEDGIAETVTADSVTLKEETLCYHCSRPIEAGTDAVKLTAADGDVYVLHLQCAKKSVER